MKSRVCGRCGSIVVGDCPCKRKLESVTSKGYGRRWQRFRERLYRKRAKKGVVCGLCGKAFGNVSPHADHIIPVTGEDDPLFYDETNIQFLHPECHGVKTKKDVALGLTR